MKKYLVILNLFALLLIPNKVFAEEEFVEVSSTTKYYKTITYYEDSGFYTTNEDSDSSVRSYTVEVTEEEYYNHDNGINPQSTTVTTEYKKMVSSISSNGSKYRYRVVLDWQQIPKTRSYDIIGIGHPKDVKLSGDLHFAQDYCTNDGCSCTVSYTGTKSSTGATSTFKLPSGTLTALIQTFYFDVEKNASTVTSQSAYGDYSHATKTITKTNALKHTVGTSGIKLKSEISSYYDSISYALARWTGSW